MRYRKSLRNRKAKIQNRNHKKTRYGMLGQGLTGVDAREVSRRGVTGESRRINAINSRSPVKVTRKGVGGLNTRTKLIEFRELVVSIAMIESRTLSAVEIHNILLKKRSLARKSTLAFNDKLKLKWVAEVLNNSARFAGLSTSYLFVATDEQDDIGNTRFKLDLES